MKILNNINILENDWIKVIKSVFLDRNKHEKSYYWVQRNKTKNAVQIVAFYKQFIVLVNEFRVPLNDYELSIPGGLLEEWESIEDCAKRELFEETGLNIKRIINKTPLLYNSAGLTDEACSIVYVEAEGKLSHKNHEESEDIELILVNSCYAGILLEKAKNGNIKMGAKTYLILKEFYYAHLL